MSLVREVMSDSSLKRKLAKGKGGEERASKRTKGIEEELLPT